MCIITDYSMQLWILRIFKFYCGANYPATMALNGRIHNNAFFTPLIYENKHINRLRVIVKSYLQ